MDTALRFIDHVQEANEVNPCITIYVAMQGSQNYGLAYEDSDVDTKAIVVPTLRQIVKNDKPISYTHVRENNEHIDFKDIRLMFDCFRKQNINFVEILFSDYFWMQPYYSTELQELRNNAELIARMDPYAAVKCMKGMVYEKLHALEHPYPAKAAIIAEHGYDGKQLSHICRIEEFLTKYIAGESYAKCLKSDNREELILFKQHTLPLAEARILAAETAENVAIMADEFCKFADRETFKNKKTFQLLEDIQYDIIKKSLEREVKGYGE